MMEVEYRREMNRNYMVIRPEITGSEKYTIRMLSGNTIQGLLAFQDKMINGEVRYYYDITSKQPLSRVLEHRTISGKELRTLIRDLLYMLRQLERFLLDEGQLCLQPEYIYVDPDSFQGEFCLVPGVRKEFPAELCELAQYLLDHVNHSDGDAVVLAFSVFKECRKLNFGIEDIERCLRQQEKEGDLGGNRKEDVLEKAEDTKRPVEKAEEAFLPLDESEKREEISEKKELSGGKMLGVTAAGVGVLMAAVPAVILFVFGIDGLRRWKWALLGGEILAAMVLGGLLKSRVINRNEDWEEPSEVETDGCVQKKRLGKYPEKKEREAVEKEPWEVYFWEEENRETMLDSEFEQYEPDTGKYNEDEENEIQTTLLNVRPIESKCRKLVSANGGPDISIGYFPFLIGKNKSLTDYCLNRPGVSRLHVKFEETSGGYKVTDLNSTNGTMVNGILLEANETAGIKPGDELVIAGERFYFR